MAQDKTGRSQSRGPERIDVVLPAGGRISGAFAQAAGAEIKALIRIGEQTILRRTIEVFRATGRVGRIIVVGPEAALKEARAAGADGTLPEGDTGPENFFRGLAWLREQSGGPAARVTIAATDLPFLTPEAIHHYWDSCPAQVDIAVPVLAKAAFEARFPGSENLYVPLREGEITIGCVFQVNPDVLMRNRPHIERVFHARKSQFQMARLVGWRVALGLATKRLTIRAIEERCGQILGCRGAGVPDCAPELGFDIDQPQEFHYVRQQREGPKVPAEAAR